MQCGAFLDQVPDTEGDIFQAELAGFHFRDVQYVVQQAKQAFAGVQGNFHPVALSRVQFALQGQPQHTENAIQGRAYLVAHAGQEVGPCPCSPNRILLGFHQGTVTPLQGLVLLRDFPGTVCHFLFKLSGVVLHGTLCAPKLGKA